MFLFAFLVLVFLVLFFWFEFFGILILAFLTFFGFWKPVNVDLGRVGEHIYVYDIYTCMCI